MCSTFKFKNCMGRNYDYETSYKEEVIFIPKDEKTCQNKYSILGIGSGLFQEYPMLYDGMNSKGLCCSGLAFTGNAKYDEFNKDKFNLPVYKLIPFTLGNFKTVADFKSFAKEERLNLTDTRYDDNTPNAELHWLLCDTKDCIVIESTKDGLNIYDNPYHTMTNNPPFNEQKEYYESFDFIGEDEDYYLKELGKEWSTRGLETCGLSGGYTSTERFERLTYLKQHLLKHSKADPILDSFKLCSSVEQLYGCTPVGDKFEYTIYQSVYDMSNLTLQTRKYNQLSPKQWVTQETDEICRWQL